MKKSVKNTAEQMEQVKTPIEVTPDACDQLTTEQLLNVDPSHDSKALIGRRFLTRGNGGLIVGTTGAGKSVLALQLATQLAIGDSFFGIRNLESRPLKVLVIQAENDMLEVAEVLQSLTEGLSAEKRKKLVSNLIIRYIWDKSGTPFLRELSSLAEECDADVVIVDPLLAYMEGSISDNQAVSRFLRGDVNRLLKNTALKKQFGLLFVHHTNKSTGKVQNRSAMQLLYDLHGGAELANWARCIIHLERVEEGSSPTDVCLLSIPKRGARSGLQANADAGQHACLLRHAQQKPGAQRPVLRWEACNDVLIRKASH